MRAWLAATFLVVVAVLLPSRANAFERQWHVGMDAGYASLFGDNSAGGYGGGAHLTYGLTDAFNALLDIDVTRQPSAHTTIASGGAGVAYTLDVARLVPYAGLLAGGYRLGGDLSTTAPGIQVALGLDYALDRAWSIGLQFRMHTIFARDPIGPVAYATTFLRFEYVWGF